LLKHQLLIVNRPRRRAPNLRVTDRFIVAVCSLFIRPARTVRSAIILRPSTILNFHRNLVKLKYRRLFCPKRRAKPGPKGPNQDLIHAVVEMKLRNPDWGCPRIAAQISLAFGVLIKVLVQIPMVETLQRMSTVELLSRPEQLPRLPTLWPVGSLAFRS